MLTRIVKLTIKTENIARFEQLFEETKTVIKSFEGCEKLLLYKDMNTPGLFFTYSHWKNQAALENYRNSDFFKEVWSNTKKLFAEKADAWSLLQSTEVK